MFLNVLSRFHTLHRTVLIRLLKFIVLISLSTHFVACLWYLLACQIGECNPNTWAEVAGMIMLLILFCVVFN